MHLPLSSSLHVLYDSVESLLPWVEILSACRSKAGWRGVSAEKEKCQSGSKTMPQNLLGRCRAPQPAPMLPTVGPTDLLEWPRPGSHCGQRSQTTHGKVSRWMAAPAYDLGPPHSVAPIGPGVFSIGDPPLLPPSGTFLKSFTLLCPLPRGPAFSACTFTGRLTKTGDGSEEGSYSFPPLSLLCTADVWTLLSHQIVTVFKALLIPFLTQTETSPFPELNPVTQIQPHRFWAWEGRASPHGITEPGATHTHKAR